MKKLPEHWPDSEKGGLLYIKLFILTPISCFSRFVIRGERIGVTRATCSWIEK